MTKICCSYKARACAFKPHAGGVSKGFKITSNIGSKRHDGSLKNSASVNNSGFGGFLAKSQKYNKPAKTEILLAAIRPKIDKIKQCLAGFIKDII